MEKRDTKKQRRTLLSKLHFEHDQSVDREIIESGRIRRAIGMFSGRAEGHRFRDLALINILTLITLVPFIVILLYLAPLLETKAIEGLNFSGDLGLGYPGTLNDYVLGATNVFNARISILAYLIPCFTSLGIGMAGAFYCMRNYSWGMPVDKKILYFFRGIKKYGVTFALAFTFIGALAFLVGFSVLRHLKLLLVSTTTVGEFVGSYFFMILISLVALFYMVYLMFFLPHVMCYKVKWRYHFRNALIFSVSLFPLGAVNVLLIGAPMLLVLIPTFGTIVFYALAGFLLLGYYALWFMSVGQFAFDRYIEKTVKFKEIELQRIASSEKNKQKKQSEVKEQPKYVSYKRKKK